MVGNEAHTAGDAERGNVIGFLIYGSIRTFDGIRAMTPIIINRRPYPHCQQVFAIVVQLVGDIKLVGVNIAFVSSKPFAIEPDVSVIICRSEL